MIGASLAHYRIVSKLGEGGMGAVYRATDTKLGRDVAIKVLPPALANDADYLARFQREAQVLASLNHPNIAAIYGLEDNAIVMELVEGEELKGPLPLDEAVRIAKQIADALEAAHERGIVHRDLKPANIKITAGGTVKVLDFGLAKATEPAKAASASSANSPTLTLHATQAGMILGTAAYMAPEQARGQSVDRRADIWAFGVVFWELLTGRQMFGGETVSDVLAGVLRAEPDLGAVPAQVRPVLAACLEKNPRNRLAAMGDWARLLSAPAVPARAGRSSRIPWIIAATAATAAFAAGGWALSRNSEPPASRPMVTLRAEFGDRNTALGPRIPGHLFAVSPDGTKLAFISSDPEATTGLTMMVRHLSSDRLQRIPRTDGAHTPFFSPDSNQIAFWAEGKLWKVRSEGGDPVPICDSIGLRGGAWTDNNQIIFSTGRGALQSVSADGGTPAAFTTLEDGEVQHRYPQIRPGSDVLLFAAFGGGAREALYALSLKTGRRALLRSDSLFGRELPAGRLIFMQGAALYAARFDPAALELKSTPVTVLPAVHKNVTGGASLSVSDSGFIVYAQTTFQPSRLFRVRRGRPGEPYPFTIMANPEISPDGKKLAFQREEGIWIRDLERGTEFRLANSNFPRFVWTADGKRIVFNDQDALWSIYADGGSRPELLAKSGNVSVPAAFSSDGKVLLLAVRDQNSVLFNLATAPAAWGPTPSLGPVKEFLDADHKAGIPALSRDGRWVAYHSQEDGTSKIYVRSYVGLGPRVQVSKGWGEQPRFSRGRNELFYQGADRRVMVVPYSVSDGSFVPGVPARWGEEIAYEMSGAHTFDVMPDGESLLVLANLGGPQHGGETHLNFVLNFFDEVKRRLP